MSGFQKALPMALTVFCGVVGGYYTFQPVFAPDQVKDNLPRQSAPASSEELAKLPAPETK